MRINFANNEYLNVTATLLESGVPFPNELKEYAGVHNKFRCTISNPVNGRKMQVTWYDSQVNYMNGVRELNEGMARSILSSVDLDASFYENAVDFDGFCKDLGYSNDSIRALKIYKACKSMYERWSRVSEGLSEESMEEIYNY